MVLCINKNSYFVFFCSFALFSSTQCVDVVSVFFLLTDLFFFRWSVSLQYSFLVLSLRWNAICYAACRLSMFSFNLDILQGKIKQKKKHTHRKIQAKWNTDTHTKTHFPMSQLSAQPSPFSCFVHNTHQMTCLFQHIWMHAVTLHAKCASCRLFVVDKARDDNIITMKNLMPLAFGSLLKKIMLKKNEHKNHWNESKLRFV